MKCGSLSGNKSEQIKQNKKSITKHFRQTQQNSF